MAFKSKETKRTSRRVLNLAANLTKLASTPAGQAQVLNLLEAVRTTQAPFKKD